jgi:hypothetical protein
MNNFTALFIFLTCSIHLLKLVLLQDLSLPFSLSQVDSNDGNPRWTDWMPFLPSPLDDPISTVNQLGKNQRRFFRRYLRPFPIYRRPRLSQSIPIFQPPAFINTLAFKLLKFTNDARMRQGLRPLCLNL